MHYSVTALGNQGTKPYAECYVFSGLYRNPVQTQEVTPLEDDLLPKRCRCILLAPRSKEKASNPALDSASRPSDNSRSRKQCSFVHDPLWDVKGSL